LPGRQSAPGQRDDLVRLLSGQKPHNLAANLTGGTGHRDSQHALQPRLRQLDLDGYKTTECLICAAPLGGGVHKRNGSSPMHRVIVGLTSQSAMAGPGG
jgi:hypothetical protein